MDDGKVISIDSVYALARERKGTDQGRCTPGDISHLPAAQQGAHFSFDETFANLFKILTITESPKRKDLEGMLSQNAEENAIILRCTREELLRNPEYKGIVTDHARKMRIDAARFSYAIPVSPTDFPNFPAVQAEDEPLFRYRHEMSLLFYEFYVANAAFLKDRNARRAIMPVERRHAGEATLFTESRPDYEWLQTTTKHKTPRLKEQYMKSLSPGFWSMLTNRYSDREVMLAAQETALHSEEEFCRDGSYMRFVEECARYTDAKLKEVMTGGSEEHGAVRLVDGMPAEEKIRNNKRLRLVK
jgi:hypothetical protein